MEPPNAFIGKTTRPTPEELHAALGSACSVWNQLVDWIAEHGAADQEWKSYSPKAGWALRLQRKKRNIVYLAPCDGCFRVAYILGDKAVAAARAANPSEKVLQLLDEATRYPEGTGVRILVKTSEDLDAVRQLALIKMAN
jgi:hypothetical protein